MKLSALKRKLHATEEKIRRAAPVLAVGGTTTAITIEVLKTEVSELSQKAMHYQDKTAVRDMWISNLEALGNAISNSNQQAIVEAATTLYSSLNTGHEIIRSMFNVGGTNTPSEDVVTYVAFFQNLV